MAHNKLDFIDADRKHKTRQDKTNWHRTGETHFCVYLNTKVQVVAPSMRESKGWGTRKGRR